MVRRSRELNCSRECGFISVVYHIIYSTTVYEHQPKLFLAVHLRNAAKMDQNTATEKENIQAA